jgi:hypothetical protein
MQLVFSENILEKQQNTEFDKNPSIGSRDVLCRRKEGQTDRQTDMKKLIDPFCNFAKSD